MKTVLFCVNPYSFGILEPIAQVLKEKKHEYIWFVKEEILDKFPFKEEKITSKIEDLIVFKSDAIFSPGNEVPHYLRGVKTQVFHGLAGEKKGHFRIRHYFDLYLTQGPYFTKWFALAAKKHQNFNVVETGWPKLDVYGKELHKYDADKSALLKKYDADKIILYAPTFSPSLTSAPYLFEEIKKLATNKEYLIVIKFHDLMAKDLIEKYQVLAEITNNILFVEERNIIKYLLIADLMISDTSSVVYEFLLLDKPVITFKNNSTSFDWENSLTYDFVLEKVKLNLTEDPFHKKRKVIVDQYHPYKDGNSAERMVIAVEDYITENGVPEKRNLPWLRRRKMNKMFGEF
ncbi:MAG: CDP-glycerol glycerophosphotransferase family protein [Polaribacter sp.]|nr:CDP-glycerol glycerophosphotransferase family protein [Polaribacter sp.]MDG1953350.1 CDP-glycerol glycerophosphotransferase family protein [Polaribacter sp.]MDG1993154.1 CDP-glycerol glycerophosphotransferase family protein [Polaribacter sp.]